MKKGLLPGTPVYIGDTTPQASQYQVLIYNEQTYELSHTLNSDSISKSLDAGFYVWVDITGLSHLDDISAFLTAFDIHPLVIEDVFNTNQRSKLDTLDTLLFLVLRILKFNQNNEFDSEQFSVIKKGNLLISISEQQEDHFLPLYHKIQAEPSFVRTQGIDYLMYLLLDTIIDDYFHIVDTMSNQLQHVEDRLFGSSELIPMTELYLTKRHLTTMRKAISPTRDMMHLLMSQDDGISFKKYQLYFRDLYDHCLRLVEIVDSQRELANSLVEMYLSIQNNRMSETMKILTIFASIFIPLTFITGFYGMNFSNMPGLNWRYGYPLVTGIMFVTVSAMLYYFKRRKII